MMLMVDHSSPLTTRREIVTSYKVELHQSQSQLLPLSFLGCDSRPHCNCHERLYSTQDVVLIGTTSPLAHDDDLELPVWFRGIARQSRFPVHRRRCQLPADFHWNVLRRCIFQVTLCYPCQSAGHGPHRSSSIVRAPLVSQVERRQHSCYRSRRFRKRSAPFSMFPPRGLIGAGL